MVSSILETDCGAGEGAFGPLSLSEGRMARICHFLPGCIGG